MKNEPETPETTIRRLRRQNRELRRLLASFEWVMPRNRNSPSCPCCDETQPGHKAHCGLRTALAGDPQP